MSNRMQWPRGSVAFPALIRRKSDRLSTIPVILEVGVAPNRKQVRVAAMEVGRELLRRPHAVRPMRLHGTGGAGRMPAVYSMPAVCQRQCVRRGGHAGPESIWVLPR